MRMHLLTVHRMKCAAAAFFRSTGGSCVGTSAIAAARVSADRTSEIDASSMSSACTGAALITCGAGGTPTNCGIGGGSAYCSSRCSGGVDARGEKVSGGNARL